ncbi:MAG: RelA/SpoT domain-containing protein [Neisseria sp.]|uniref:RelA/SpoT domain-containing protein n=1 Tax=Neisseria sp. TaxID=192066 RepID=UPI001CB4657B|nr:RelA/SpoT domain-containing protein [Neisseria sp.]MBF1277756.1 RelA/SpoT domain-containing protein [Neisseria sp.]
MMDYTDDEYQILKKFEEEKTKYETFSAAVISFFEKDLECKEHIHSIRCRTKDADHLIKKIRRKNEKEKIVTVDNLFEKVTDLVGIRVLHLHLSQFEYIHNSIIRQINEKEWALFEPPQAYTWDIESKEYFENKLKINTKLKESYYTSIHYVVKPRHDAFQTCEIQVRTLLEETWGEIDHTMNYPQKHNDEYCQSQLKVLARLINASGHLADLIMNQYKS